MPDRFELTMNPMCRHLTHSDTKVPGEAQLIHILTDLFVVDEVIFESEILLTFFVGIAFSTSHSCQAGCQRLGAGSC
jgi:hypothetical protein